LSDDRLGCQLGQRVQLRLERVDLERRDVVFAVV